VILESALAYLHIACVLGWVVFLTSQAALLRTEWLNAAVLARLVRVAQLADWCAVAVLATGLARAFWGLKGLAWYAGQPLWWLKLVLAVAMAASGWRVRRRLLAWHAAGGLPDTDDLAAVRRQVMWSSHLMLLAPLAGVLLARGLLTR
jgi:putative membrane protein